MNQEKTLLNNSVPQSQKQTPQHITVLGGGLVGCLLALYLSRQGHSIELVEKRPDPRKAQWDVGRSINLALSDRGWHALEGVGIAEEVRKSGIPMYGRMIHPVQGDLTLQPYGKEGQAIYSVSRAKLNEVLLGLAEDMDNVAIRFNERCTEINLEQASLTLQNLESNETTHLNADIVFGADGAFSPVRGTMQRTNRFNYSQHYIEHGYKELTIPAKSDGSWALEPNALHIWPRGHFMLIALPNQDGSFTCTLFFPFEGTPSFESLQEEAQIRDFFYHTFPDIVALAPDLVEQYLRNPTSSMVSIKCFPWTYQDKVALIGDAAHGIVPFFGQGMNAGFEDCVVLNTLIQEYGNNWLRIFDEYQQLRKPNTDAIADLALQNFVEMRDLVADPKFLLRKKIEAHLHKHFPTKWTPLYSMVTFSLMPYAEALRIGKIQDKVMDIIMKIDAIESIWPTLDYNEILEELAETDRF